MNYGNTEIFLSPEQREELIRSLMGKTVEIVIDRPIGHVHVTKGVTLRYTVNYGFLPGVMGGDGEEQDVYLLGVSEPVERFTATIIGAIRRKDDNEDKLVAAPAGLRFHQTEIREATWFVEQYFDSSVDSLLHRSCGVIPCRHTVNGPELLLILQSNGCWSFPKGHLEQGESEEQTALRELREETGLVAALVPGFREMIEYSMGENRRKQVVLFLGLVTGEPTLNDREVRSFRWVKPEDAKALLLKEQYPIIDRILREGTL